MVDRIHIGSVIVFALILMGFMGFMVFITKQDERIQNWCAIHNLKPTGGDHSPILCYDPKTRLVYKPE